MEFSLFLNVGKRDGIEAPVEVSSLLGRLSHANGRVGVLPHIATENSGGQKGIEGEIMWSVDNIAYVWKGDRLCMCGMLTSRFYPPPIRRDVGFVAKPRPWRV